MDAPIAHSSALILTVSFVGTLALLALYQALMLLRRRFLLPLPTTGAEPTPAWAVAAWSTTLLTSGAGGLYFVVAQL